MSPTIPQELNLWKETRKHTPVLLSRQTSRVKQWVRAEGLALGGRQREEGYGLALPLG